MARKKKKEYDDISGQEIIETDVLPAELYDDSTIVGYSSFAGKFYHGFKKDISGSVDITGNADIDDAVLSFTTFLAKMIEKYGKDKYPWSGLNE